MQKNTPMVPQPKRQKYDVIIVGGAMIGASVAWYLSANADFDGSILVVEQDPSYQNSGTAHTNSCVRQQFSNEINVKISQYAVEFIRDFAGRIGDPEAPEIPLHSFGYMYLATTNHFAKVLQENQRLQAACGAGTRILEPDALAQAFPFYKLDDIVLGCHNPVDEGYFDGNTMFDWWRRKARQNGAEYVTNQVVSMSRAAGKVTTVTLASGEVLGVGHVVNASGTRAAVTASMAGIAVPIEPRKRYTYVFEAERPLPCDLPLTVDPSGVHVRTDGMYYMAGSPPMGDDLAVEYDDFTQDHTLWEEKVWPAIANRIPQFESIRVINSWVGNYAYNTLDQNAVVGPHPEVSNFIFVNGFSGHGFQQAPAMGRGVMELLTYGEFRGLDLTPFAFQRIIDGVPFLEKAII